MDASELARLVSEKLGSKYSRSIVDGHDQLTIEGLRASSYSTLLTLLSNVERPGHFRVQATSSVTHNDKKPMTVTIDIW